MGKRLQYFFLALTVLAAGMVSCTREVVSDHAVKGHELTFTAIHADSKDTKTALQDNGTSIWWTPGEQINIFYGTTFGGKFTSSNSEPQATTTFSGTLTVVTGSIESGAASAYWAVYPYNEANTCDGESVTLTVPSVQAGVAGTFADKFFPTVATSTTLDLAFYNVCGGACIKVSQTGITEIIIKSADGTPVAGKVNVGFGGDGKPLVKSVIQGEDQVRLLAPDGGFVPGEVYYAALLPGAHSQGLLIGYSKADYYGATKVIDKSITVHRSVFGRLFELDNGLTFTMGGGSAAAVDLGLSVKWAACNLGATKPEEYGDYVAWGETEPKDVYWWSTYKWNSSNPYLFTKYCTESTYWDSSDPLDNKTVLDPEDDAARAKWGGSWRMPTSAEWTELMDNCTWTWTDNYNGTGIRGRVITASNGNSIFLPAAGYRDNTNFIDVGSFGYYWSSSLYDTPIAALHTQISSDSYRSDTGGSRFYGESIRPVYDNSIPVTSITLDRNSLELEVGGSAQLTATILPLNATKPSVDWVSENTSIVSVNQAGKVSARAKGSTTITAYSSNGLSASCSVVVNDPPVVNNPLTEIGKAFEAVDLGLSVKWASFNLGATKPEQYGDYFAWGETEPKSDYSWTTYKWCNGDRTKLTKYCLDSSYWDSSEPRDNKTELDPEDDAARVVLGGSWRMPSDAEWTELWENCTWTYTENYNGTGIKGRVVAASNGNSIFLPAAGQMIATGPFEVSSGGYYWSSSLAAEEPYYAWNVAFYSNSVSRGYFCYRYYGQSVRPVTE